MALTAPTEREPGTFRIGWNRRHFWFFAVVIYVAVVFVLWFRYQSLVNLASIEALIRQHAALSVPVFAAIYAVAVSVMLPTLPLNVFAGWFWGGILGGVVSALAATLGSIVSFLIARGAFGELLAGWAARRYSGDLINRMNRNDWKVLLFIRLTPIFPTGPINFLFGMTQMRLSVFTLWTIVGLIPPSIAVAFVGQGSVALALDAQLNDVTRMLRLFAVGVVALIALFLAGRYALRKMTRP
jgi:uncharacterized membrane protein YdjX (TVP38/TMEM64 family)